MEIVMPTQAQIEAAAKALYRYANNNGAKDCAWTVYIAEAQAALTAAAQVEEPYVDAGLIAKIATAEKEKRDIAVAKMKERCAQVAEKWERESYPGDFKTLLARIRKLKDEP
jgi:hypothetical protein